MELRKVLLATLAYHDIFEYPLTSFEAWRFLIQPRRLGLSELPSASLAAIIAELERLVQSGDIVQENGFYALAGRGQTASERLRREKIAAQKWQTFLRRARWLQLCPWIEGFFVSGSLALGNTTADSDFDILMIMKPGRLYLGRLCISAWTSLLGIRRTRSERRASDKLCFNHYLTADCLEIRHQSLYNAQTYARLVPVYISADLDKKFFDANAWIGNFILHSEPYQIVRHRTIQPNGFLRAVVRLAEWILDHSIGDFLEHRAKRYQQRRIANNPATHAAGGRVVYTDSELEFHPHSFERTVLDHYNRTLRGLSISEFFEKDSGLN
ncbi:MAG TPA: hypothetical protein VG941_00340 [Candidatus Paceibacterota bacterium]|nr:hypothetical protein [Candidatus Paceibacterota bacterium]